MRHRTQGLRISCTATALFGLALVGGAPIAVADTHAQPASPGALVLQGGDLDRVSAAGFGDGFVLDPTSLAVLQTFLDSLSPTTPPSTSQSLSQSSTPASSTPASSIPAPDLPLAPILEPPAPQPETMTTNSTTVSVSVMATASACCGQSATASTFVSSTIGGRVVLLRDAGQVDPSGRVVASSTFNFPASFRIWGSGQ